MKKPVNTCMAGFQNHYGLVKAISLVLYLLQLLCPFLTLQVGGCIGQKTSF